MPTAWKAHEQQWNKNGIFSIIGETHLAASPFFGYTPAMTKPLLEGFAPTTIADPTLRKIVNALMNQVETLHEQTRTQAAEIQRLRDEIARLKGEQCKPNIKPSRAPDAQHDRSSEAERKPPRTPRGKRARNQNLTVTREEVVRIDPATLPADAQFKGYQPVIVQDVLLSSEVIRFQKEISYSPDQRQTYTAPLPPGYGGEFGPNTSALALTLSYDSGLSMPTIQALFALAGVQISAGQVAAFLTQEHETFHDERQEILIAGLESAPYSISTRLPPAWMASTSTATPSAIRCTRCI
jgi:hypothetical protein